MFLRKIPFRITSRSLHLTACCTIKEKRPEDYQVIDARSIEPPPQENPFFRTGRILKADLLKVKRFFSLSDEDKKPENISLHKHVLLGDDKETIITEKKDDDYLFPSYCDILIIGGGAIGSSIAYWLKERAREGLNVVVVEKDKTVSRVQCSELGENYFHYIESSISVCPIIDGIICWWSTAAILIRRKHPNVSF